ncbi:MAG: SsrA-binding protein [Candidatus Harrisonbacteria bacterium RIFOXYA1_FULL_48_8]|uniref:SsrA-binding protein n=4 Tax=Parcubacteria group TaxID=1794811 RepID=A0A0G1MMZ5_9BACT|nr:MAG: SsrA-binding protein [Candidatus Azambacteria bacterium GW2011_GWA1_44_9]KKU76579.1 MAG: SsrA-binding protein [Candidatus Giovannonibacteria bacterium GW2011_GWB1_47_6b]OGY65122.1 MAG: SsrA-binding protein [Candidatus Harrisonbacteria bacterium RIFCSPHIGHO2_12_FULL_48_16]OGY68403.1 MAG: SsrA-binding protein [Candidatus Harrisonbacteria bacterium RIFOXYA1_FULL_48_8]
MSALSENRKAYFNYEILETLEAGIELRGYEVKAVKSGRASITGAFATIKDEQIWLTNADIPPYQPKNTPADYDPQRSRRLLLKKSEITYLIGKLQSERLTVVPLKLYNKGGRIKVELGLARGKRKYEKRETIKKRETQREIRRTLKK